MKARALLLAVSLFGLSHSRAQDAVPAPPQIWNLHSIGAADALASELIANGQPLMIMHIGDRIPRELSWLVLRLEGKHVPFKIRQVTEAELRGSLAGQGAEAAEIRKLEYGLSVGEREVVTQGSASFGKRLGFSLRKLTHLPNGITLMFQLKRNWRNMSIEALTAAGTSVGAYISVYASTSLRAASHPDVSAPWMAAGIFSAWAFFPVSIIGVFCSSSIRLNRSRSAPTVELNCNRSLGFSLWESLRAPPSRARFCSGQLSASMKSG